MRDEDKTKDQLIRELLELRRTISELKIVELKNQERYLQIEKLEYKLAAERQRLFSILDGLPALVYLVAPDNSIRFSNKFFQERFKKPGADTCYMIFHDRTEPCNECISFNNGNAIESLKCRRNYSGGYTYETYNYPFTDVDGSKMLLTFGIDITERKHAEEALRKSELDLRKITDNMMDMIRCTNIKGIIEYASPSHINILGYMPEDLVGRAVLDIVHPNDVEKIREFNRKRFKFNSKAKLEYRMRHSDGHYLWVETIGNLIFEEDGEISGVIYCSREITDRKQAEEALRISEEKFSKAFRCNPDPIPIMTLKEGRYIEVNDKWLDIFGYDRHEVIGHTVEKLGTWVFPHERDLLIEQIQEKGSLRDYEVMLRTKSGEIRFFLLSSEIIDVDGEPHLICVSKDITDRKNMEKALRLSEERFSKAFNSNPMAMSISTLENGRFININESFCHMIGSNSDELLGRTSLEIGIFREAVDRNQIIDRIINNEVVRDQEFVFYMKTGEQRLGSLSIERLDINGEHCILSTLVDITERRQMEIEITRLDRLNLVGEMAASIGHEIRNPMTSVRGFLQMFESKYNEDKEFLHLMIEELDRANAIITEFLSLAKNKMVELVPKNLNSVLNNILPLIQANAMIQDKTIKLKVEHLPDLLLDEKEIRQLILNLVYNGLESMSPGSTMTIRTFTKGKSVVLAIQDQGQGVEPAVLDKLGTPFFTTKEQGTGLGLAVCYGIAKRHNARIDINTSSNGTTFYVSFPV